MLQNVYWIFCFVMSCRFHSLVNLGLSSQPWWERERTCQHSVIVFYFYFYFYLFQLGFNGILDGRVTERTIWHNVKVSVLSWLTIFFNLSLPWICFLRRWQNDNSSSRSQMWPLNSILLRKMIDAPQMHKQRIIKTPSRHLYVQASVRNKNNIPRTFWDAKWRRTRKRKIHTTKIYVVHR